MSGQTEESSALELEKPTGERKSCFQHVKDAFSLVPKDATPPNWGILWLVFISLVDIHSSCVGLTVSNTKFRGSSLQCPLFVFDQ